MVKNSLSEILKWCFEEMNIVDYYENFKAKVVGNIDTTLKPTNHYHTLVTKNRSFCEDYEKWMSILGNSPETVIYRNAVKVYQEAFGNMLMGLYQPAFMGLRYFLERTLVGVYFSGSELELRTWMHGQRDTYWSELIGEEDEDKVPDKKKDEINVNKGLFSLKFTRAFFEDFSGAAKAFRAQTKKVYRECSEFVHGNPTALKSLGETIDYSEEVASKWNDCADTVARCILYAFMMRYWLFINEDQRGIVIERLREEFSTTDIIKEFL